MDDDGGDNGDDDDHDPKTSLKCLSVSLVRVTARWQPTPSPAMRPAASRLLHRYEQTRGSRRALEKGT